MALGFVLVAIGMAVLSWSADTPYPVLLLAMIAAGRRACRSPPRPATGAIMSAVPLAKAGVGSAVNDTTRELGGALGIAVFGSIVNSRLPRQPRPRRARAARATANARPRSRVGAAAGVAAPSGGDSRPGADRAGRERLHRRVQRGHRRHLGRHRGGAAIVRVPDVHAGQGGGGGRGGAGVTVDADPQWECRTLHARRAAGAD